MTVLDELGKAMARELTTRLGSEYRYYNNGMQPVVRQITTSNHYFILAGEHCVLNQPGALLYRRLGWSDPELLDKIEAAWRCPTT